MDFCGGVSRGSAVMPVDLGGGVNLPGTLEGLRRE